MEDGIVALRLGLMYGRAGIFRMVFHKVIFSKKSSRRPDRHEVEWILWVTGLEIFVLNHLLQGDQLTALWNGTVLNILGNGLQRRSGKVKEEHGVADELP